MEGINKIIDKFYQEIGGLPEVKQEKKIKELYRYLWARFEAREIDRKELAYTIAGTMQFEATQKGVLKNITELAGELELPDHQILENIEEKYQELAERLLKYLR